MKASVVYLRTEYKNGFVESRIIASKAKVAPIKKQTIPKLEVMGALLLAQLVVLIHKVLSQELEPKRIERICWVDSLALSAG